MVRHCLGYGGTQPITQPASCSSSSSNKPNSKPTPTPPQWFELQDDQNPHVYVSNLPKDIDESAFVEFMGKCGLVMKDPTSGAWKVKLYRNGDGTLKGDATCTYIKVDSVTLALQILDQSEFHGNIVTVERAKFQMKGEYDPTKKPKQKKKRDKVKLKRMTEKLFSWKPEKLRGERGKHEKVVVVKHAFHPDEFNEDVGLILELKEDFKSEAGKFGACRKVDLFDNNTDGALKIHMTSPEEADAVISNFNGRFFGGRQLEAYIWDGFEKLNVVETEAEKEKRLEKWAKYVDEDDEDEQEKRGGGDGGGKRIKIDGEVTPPRIGDRDIESDDERNFDED